MATAALQLTPHASCHYSLALALGHLKDTGVPRPRSSLEQHKWMVADHHPGVQEQLAGSLSPRVSSPQIHAAAGADPGAIQVGQPGKASHRWLSAEELCGDCDTHWPKLLRHESRELCM